MAHSPLSPPPPLQPFPAPAAPPFPSHATHGNRGCGRRGLHQARRHGPQWWRGGRGRSLRPPRARGGGRVAQAAAETGAAAASARIQERGARHQPGPAARQEQAEPRRRACHPHSDGVWQSGRIRGRPRAAARARRGLRAPGSPDSHRRAAACCFSQPRNRCAALRASLPHARARLTHPHVPRAHLRRLLPTATSAGWLLATATARHHGGKQGRVGRTVGRCQRAHQQHRGTPVQLPTLLAATIPSPHPALSPGRTSARKPPPQYARAPRRPRSRVLPRPWVPSRHRLRHRRRRTAGPQRRPRRGCWRVVASWIIIAWGACAREWVLQSRCHLLTPQCVAVSVERVQHVALRGAALRVWLASRGWLRPWSGAWAAVPRPALQLTVAGPCSQPRTRNGRL